MIYKDKRINNTEKNMYAQLEFGTRTIAKNSKSLFLWVSDEVFKMLVFNGFKWYDTVKLFKILPFLPPIIFISYIYIYITKDFGSTLPVICLLHFCDLANALSGFSLAMSVSCL